MTNGCQTGCWREGSETKPSSGRCGVVGAAPRLEGCTPTYQSKGGAHWRSRLCPEHRETQSAPLERRDFVEAPAIDGREFRDGMALQTL